jgi:hypothetical protein
MRPCRQRRNRLPKAWKSDPPVSGSALLRAHRAAWFTRCNPTLSWVGVSFHVVQSPAFAPRPPPPPSPQALFFSFAGTTPMFDSSPTSLHGLCLWLPVPIRRLVGPACWRGLSVLARAVSPRVHGSWTTPACRELAMAFPPVLPSRCEHTVGARIAFFEAQFPARRCLCLRFTRHLATPGARLEVEMVRYSFLGGALSSPTARRLSRRKRVPMGLRSPNGTKTRRVGHV